MATSDKDQAEQGKTIQVGIAMVNKPTPMFMKYILRAFAFISGVWAIIPQDMFNLPDDDYAYVNKWIIIANAILLFAIKFFGWHMPEK